jgi:hypothetical protein
MFVDTDDDRELLAELSGIPPGDVVDTLELMDEVFPIGFGKSWFYPQHNGRLKRMKLGSAALREDRAGAGSKQPRVPRRAVAEP